MAQEGVTALGHALVIDEHIGASRIRDQRRPRGT
jgi:hypothetical protein